MSWRGTCSAEEALDRLKGKIIVQTKGLTEENGAYGDGVILYFEDGHKLELGHVQDCCEHVYVEDVIGDYQDLIGQPLIEFQEECSDTNPIDVDPNHREYEDESYTWTFYKIASPKGWITVRFYGSSNGYYSESADIFVHQPGEDS